MVTAVLASYVEQAGLELPEIHLSLAAFVLMLNMCTAIPGRIFFFFETRSNVAEADPELAVIMGMVHPGHPVH